MSNLMAGYGSDWLRKLADRLGESRTTSIGHGELRETPVIDNVEKMALLNIASELDALRDPGGSCDELAKRTLAEQHERIEILERRLRVAEAGSRLT